MGGEGLGGRRHDYVTTLFFKIFIVYVLIKKQTTTILLCRSCHIMVRAYLRRGVQVLKG